MLDRFSTGTIFFGMAVLGVGLGITLQLTMPQSTTSISWLETTQSNEPVVSPVSPQPVNQTTVHQNAVANCDELASHPLDSARQNKGVEDPNVVPALAKNACKQALQQEPKNGRLQFQLGRAHWLGNDKATSLRYFEQASQQGHAAASFYLGEAYAKGDGLPTGADPDLDKAMYYYRLAADGGFGPAKAAFLEAQSLAKMATFDASRFQNPRYAQIIFEGNYSAVKDNELIPFTAYVFNFMKELDSEQFYDHAPECKTLLNKMAYINANLASVESVIALVENLISKSGGNFMSALGPLINSVFAQDEGMRDASVMRQHYDGCKSGVSRQMVRNLGLTGPLSKKLFPRVLNYAEALAPGSTGNLKSLLGGMQ